ncbi:TetR/AcrR family transcriptional regulator [Aliiroseovarius sp. S2029]|uniref:TetR/AcrR family transcriptional regulator n=1 Tax=Aliiroseovarius sp. S2029 TaxID=2936988 RepID=UPI0020C0FCBF|nr:TetR/AcrR family transcriptional regulator [Aliiroseovarius sp. S2029]MCK8485380.1 TetR/AcrR family transcriptional regulator [Aliiroseovarius sp. S2029]
MKRKSTDNRKAEILSATFDLAFEVGPDHVTTGGIAKQLGLTQPAIYKHFPKKEDIWNAVADKVCSQIRQNAQIGKTVDIPPADRLRRMIMAHLHLITQYPALPEIMVTRDPTGRLTDTRQRLLTAMFEFRDTLISCCEELRATGQMRPDLQPEDGATLLVGLIQSLVLRLILTRDTSHLVTEGERLLNLQLSLFECERHQP